jgi:hypothetical protein
MVQRSTICKKAIVCGLNPIAGGDARLGDIGASRLYQWVASIVIASGRDIPFGPDGLLEACSTPPSGASYMTF